MCLGGMGGHLDKFVLVTQNIAKILGRHMPTILSPLSSYTYAQNATWLKILRHSWNGIIEAFMEVLTGSYL